MNKDKSKQTEIKRKLSAKDGKVPEKQRFGSVKERKNSYKQRRRSSLLKYVSAQMTLPNLREYRKKKVIEKEHEEKQIGIDIKRSRRKSSSCRKPQHRDNLNVRKFFSRMTSIFRTRKRSLGRIELNCKKDHMCKANPF